MTTDEHFWVNDGCTVTQYTVVTMQTAVRSYVNSESSMRRNRRETKEMSKMLLVQWIVSKYKPVFIALVL